MPEEKNSKERVTEKAPEDLGFGAAMTGQRGARLVNRDGTFNVLRNRKGIVDFFSYAYLLNMSWSAFFCWVISAFLLINLFFGVAYLACGSSSLVVAGPPLGVNGVWRAFIFSVDTFSTIGYGNIVPVGRATNLLVSMEAITALLNAALVTGLVFARFSKPNVRIEFSERSVIRLAEKPAVLVRLRNLTRNEVLEVEATLIAWFRDPSDHKARHFHQLTIERNKISFLPLSWTVAHFITPESPFFGITAEEFRETFGELVIQVRGIEQTGSQTIYARASYAAEDILYGARFADQYIHDQASGMLGIDSERFHATNAE